MPTPQQLAAITAALAVVLEEPVQVALPAPPRGWAAAARLEAVGLSPGLHAIDELPRLR